MPASDPLLSSHILVVDDEHANVLLLSRVLESAGYHHVTGLVDPVQAIAFAREDPPDLILLDLHMPTMDGLEALSRLKADMVEDEQIPIIVVTGDTSSSAKRRALALGASEHLLKPADPAEVLIRVRNLLELRTLQQQMRRSMQDLEQTVESRTKELALAQLETLQLLARAAEFRDDDTEDHTRRVGEIAARIIEIMGLEDIDPEMVRLAASLHDLGKIGIPDSILLQPGPLTPEEFETMKGHTVMGAAIIGESHSPVLIMAKVIAATHHEWFDGSGYPNGLKGEEIPFVGRLVAVADVFDALTHDRPYKASWTAEEARDYIRQQAGKQFDERIAETFLRLE